MSIRFSRVAVCLALAFSLIAVTAPRSAEAVPESVLVVGNALAQHYGVSPTAVTSLLQNGVSLEGVTQLLLVKESANKSFDQVTGTYREKGNDIRKTADEFGVAAEKYSQKNVELALNRAREDAARQASEAASEKAAETTGKAINSLLGGGKK